MPSSVLKVGPLYRALATGLVQDRCGEKIWVSSIMPTAVFGA